MPFIYDYLAAFPGNMDVPNTSSNAYYAVELREIMARYELLVDDKEALAKFIKEQQGCAAKITKVLVPRSCLRCLLTCCITQHAIAVTNWQNDEASRRTEEGRVAQTERIARYLFISIINYDLVLRHRAASRLISLRWVTTSIFWGL